MDRTNFQRKFAVLITNLQQLCYLNFVEEGMCVICNAVLLCMIHHSQQGQTESICIWICSCICNCICICQKVKMRSGECYCRVCSAAGRRDRVLLRRVGTGGWSRSQSVLGAHLVWASRWVGWDFSSSTYDEMPFEVGLQNIDWNSPPLLRIGLYVDGGRCFAKWVQLKFWVFTWLWAPFRIKLLDAWKIEFKVSAAVAKR